MIALAAIIAITYARGVRSLAHRQHAWPHRRSVAAAAGVLAIIVAGFVPDGTLTGHMVEHIVLGMIVPLLFALSAPVTLALQTAPTRARRTIRTTLHCRPVTWLTNPIVGLILFGLSLVVLYLTPVLELSAHNVVVHVAVHLHLMAVGALFMWPLIGVDPIPCRMPFGARALTVMAAVPFHAFLGVAIMSTSTLLAPRAYPSLADQHRAGGLLWISGEIMTFVLLSIVVRAWLVADLRAAVRGDARRTQVVQEHPADVI
ncbi:MAG: hypothetical protein JWN99_2936 [Ilumatobacteraceae bacterium]|nr:hypothetical protein [Ilumatobacteraceae bacterium]